MIVDLVRNTRPFSDSERWKASGPLSFVVVGWASKGWSEKQRSTIQQVDKSNFKHDNDSPTHDALNSFLPFSFSLLAVSYLLFALVTFLLPCCGWCILFFPLLFSLFRQHWQLCRANIFPLCTFNKYTKRNRAQMLEFASSPLVKQS